MRRLLVLFIYRAEPSDDPDRFGPLRACGGARGGSGCVRVNRRRIGIPRIDYCADLASSQPEPLSVTSNLSLTRRTVVTGGERAGGQYMTD